MILTQRPSRRRAAARPCPAMAAIARHPRSTAPCRPGSVWTGVAAASSALGCAERALRACATCVVLLPFAQLLPLARQRLCGARAAGSRASRRRRRWRGAGPAGAAGGGQICFDAALDRSTRAQLLRGQGWAVGWARRDPRGFDASRAAAVVDRAQGLARAAAAAARRTREPTGGSARAALLGACGRARAPSGALAARGARVGAQAPAPATDRLFDAPTRRLDRGAGRRAPIRSRAALLARGARMPGAAVVDSDADASARLPDRPRRRRQPRRAATASRTRRSAPPRRCSTHSTQAQCPVALIAPGPPAGAPRARPARAPAGPAGRRNRLDAFDHARRRARVMALLRAARRDARRDDRARLAEGLPSGRHAAAGGAAAARGAVPRLGVARRDPRCATAAGIALLGRRMRSAGAAACAGAPRSLDAWLAGLRRGAGGDPASCRRCGRRCRRAGARRAAPGTSRAPTPAGACADAPSRSTSPSFAAWVDRGARGGKLRAAGPAPSAEVVITPLARAMLRPVRRRRRPGCRRAPSRRGAAPAALLPRCAARGSAWPTRARAAASARGWPSRSCFALPRVTFLRRQRRRRRAAGRQPVARAARAGADRRAGGRA